MRILMMGGTGFVGRAVVEDGVRKVDEWTARHRLVTVSFADRPLDPFFNANRPEDLETAAKAMREQDERKESIFRQSVDAEKNKADLLEKKFAEALRKAKDAPEGKPLRDFDLD